MISPFAATRANYVAIEKVYGVIWDLISLGLVGFCFIIGDFAVCCHEG